MNWLKCREVLQQETEIRDSGRPHTWMERIGILFHIALCRTCRVYLRQVASIQKILQKVSLKGFDDKASLDSERRGKMLDAMRREAESCGCGSQKHPEGE